MLTIYAIDHLDWCQNRAVAMRFEVVQYVAVGDDAADGSGIEMCSADHSMQSLEKKFHLQLSGWALVTPSCFED